MVLSAALPSPLATNAKAQGASTLKVGFLANIESLNPFRGINDADYFFYGLVYDYLFALDEDGNWQPDIATSATHDAAGFNWTYTIRTGVKWHDGSTLTASDVAFSINYQIPSGSTFFHLWAYEPYVNRIVRCGSGQTSGCGAQVTAPNQVTVYFDLPFVPGYSLYVPIIEKAQWGTVSQQDAQANYENLNPIGTGPFMADPATAQWSRGDPVILHKNPNYHVYVPQIDTIILVSGMSDVTLTQALQTGDIDVAEVTPGGYEALAGVPGVGRQEYLLSTQYWIEFGFQQLNDDKGGINKGMNNARWDQNVRQALAKATNKDAIVRTDFLGKGAVGSTLMSPITPQWHYDPAADPAVNLTYDVAAANAQLDAAGYTAQCAGAPNVRAAAHDIAVDANGQPGTVTQGTCLAFKLGVRQEYPPEQASARDLIQMWKQIGVRITDKDGNPDTFSIMTEDALSDAVYITHSIDTYIWYWSGDPDPNYLLSIESKYTLDGWSDNYWDNGTYNQLYVDHLAAFDQTTRENIVHEAERVHYTSGVYIILVYPWGAWAYREDKFEGWGDWTRHPYRQLNAFWTAPPLFRDLKPTTSSVPTPTVSLANSNGRPGEPVTITGSISDTVGGTWTLDFGDGSSTTGSFGTGTTPVSEAHTYANADVYTVRLTADNGQATQAAVGQVTIAAFANLAPDQVALLADLTSGPPGTRVNFTLSAHDAEGGTLTFRIDFADGSTDTKVVSDVQADNVTTATFSHVYPSVGSFIVTGNVSDGQATSSEGRVSVTIQVPSPPQAQGLDARVLGGVVVLVVAVAVAAAVVVRRRRRSKEDEMLPPPPPK